MKIERLQSQISIDGVLPQALDKHLPKSYLNSTSLKSELKIDGLFKKDCLKNNIEDAFSLSNIDRVLDPTIFNKNLKKIYFLLRQHLDDEDINAFIQKDLETLLINKDLFEQYNSLIVSN